MSTITTVCTIMKCHNSGIIIRNIDNSVWFFWLEMRLRHHAHIDVVIYHISFQGYNRSEFVLSFLKIVNVRKKQLRNSKFISSSRNRRHDTICPGNTDKVSDMGFNTSKMDQIALECLYNSFFRPLRVGGRRFLHRKSTLKKKRVRQTRNQNVARA